MESVMREAIQVTMAELGFIMAGIALLGVVALCMAHCRLNGRVSFIKAALVDLPRMRKETDSWTEDTADKANLAESVLNGELPPQSETPVETRPRPRGVQNGMT